MTAMNAFLSPQAVHIATDGAAYSPDGRTVCSVQKVAILPQLPCVIATRGATCLLGLAYESAERSASFDELAARVGSFCRGVARAYQAQAEAYGEPVAFERANFIVAGWSEERQRLETYAVTSHDDGELRAWTPSLFVGSDALVSPLNAEISLALDAIEAELGDLAEQPEISAVRVMEAQRAIRVEGFRDAPAGVFCQLTTLTRAAITTRVLKRWPS